MSNSEAKNACSLNNVEEEVGTTVIQDCLPTRKVALITGITGQDGSYLAELLLEKGYEVHGLVRRSSSPNTARIAHLQHSAHPMGHYPPSNASSCFKLHYGDLSDSSNLNELIGSIQPTEVYNLAAQSHVKISFELPEYTAEVDGMGTLRLLNALHVCGLGKKARFYQASTSELFGKVQEVPQRECTPFYPRSPYAVSKLFAYWSVVNYREAYGMFCSNGILFNHESPRRGENFVTRKITRAVARIHLGQQEVLELGNLNAKRDWGHARDYVEAMWMMLQHNVADDFVIATGHHHSVREFVEFAFAEIGRELEWRGEGVDEVGVERGGRDGVASGVVRVRCNPAYYRPSEVDGLIGDAAKAKRLLGWSAKVPLEELVKEMVRSDIDELLLASRTKQPDYSSTSSNIAAAAQTTVAAVGKKEEFPKGGPISRSAHKKVQQG